MPNKLNLASKYKQPEYESRQRFISYWHQINEVLSFSPDQVLEIGIGSGFVSRYLNLRGIKVTTLDIEEELEPDIIASVVSLPLDNESYDLVLCCEVLEHVKYDEFQTALSEIARVTRRGAIISLPDVNRVLRISVSLPRIGMRRVMVPFPRFKIENHEFDAERGHYWEIGKKGYSIKRVFEDIKRVGFNIVESYRDFENTYHRFIILRK